ncbi:MAG: YihY/virulence factor BrkB family protein [Chitinophagales bacterium]
MKLVSQNKKKDNTGLTVMKAVLSHFFETKTFEKGAALSYYAVFSFLPIIIIVISVSGLFFGEQAVKGEIFLEIKGVLGKDIAEQIQQFLKNQYRYGSNVAMTIIGLITLVLSATAVFYQLQNSLNDIWLIKSKPKSNVIKYFTSQFISFLIIITTGFILLASITLNSFFYKFAEKFNQSAYFSKVYFLFELFISLVFVSFLFTLMFKYLGDAIVRWKAALAGGIFTAILFSIGKLLFSIYFGNSNTLTTFGSASVIALLLVWIYYTAQIIYLGASFTYVWSEMKEYPILPDEDAVNIVLKEINRKK